MLLGESLVLELGAVDGFAASTVSSCEITTLEKLMLEKVLRRGRATRTKEQRRFGHT